MEDSKMIYLKPDQPFYKMCIRDRRYINVMFYAIDLAIPWEGMCQAYNKLMKDYVPATREGAVDVSDQ